MKKLFRTIPALLAAGLLCFPALFPSPADAAPNAWTAEALPGRESHVLSPPGMDIRDLAADTGGTAIYAAPGDSIAEMFLYKSTDTGKTWLTLETPFAADLVAVAPDDAATVAIASRGEALVYISTDGGASWQPAGAFGAGGGPASAVSAITVSPATGGIRYYAVAGQDRAGGGGIWLKSSANASPAWQDATLPPGFRSGAAVRAVAFNPDFADSPLLGAVSVHPGASVDFQVLDVTSMRWNESAGFTGFPLALVSAAGIADVSAASLAFSGDNEGGPTAAFLGLAVTGNTAAREGSGIYAIKSGASTPLLRGAGIYRVALRGNNLVAGALESNTVYFYPGPATTTIGSSRRLLSPGGEFRTAVIWAGDMAAAGTSGNESAFALSGDRGETFRDTGLIDTTLANLSDFALSADGRTIFLASDDGADLSLWRKNDSWERVLRQPGTGDYLVRLAPGNPESVYAAEKGGNMLYYSGSGGAADWSAYPCSLTIQDLAVAGERVVYALNTVGEVTASRDSGLTWTNPVKTTLGEGTGFTLVSAGGNTLLAGSINGIVAYSLDGARTWGNLPRSLPTSAGRIQVIADPDFATNRIIYAASSVPRQRIFRWTIGSSHSWTAVSASIPGGIYGLAMHGDSLYALEFDSTTNQSALRQYLSPRTVTGVPAVWGSRPTGPATDPDDSQVKMNAMPRALKEGPEDRLWALKTNGIPKLYRFDFLLTQLVLTSPSPDFHVPVNPITGIAREVTFSWNGLDDATEYQLEIAYDPDFLSLATAITVTSTESTVVVIAGPERAGDERFNFTPGTSYYCRVRMNRPAVSPYSLSRSFSVDPAIAEIVALLVPPNGATDVMTRPSFSWSPVSGATEYRFLLADNDAFSSPIVDTTVGQPGYRVAQELTYGKTYFWVVQPVGGDRSAIGIFTVRDETVAPVPPVIIEQVPPQVITIPPPPPAPPIDFPPQDSQPPTGTPFFWTIIIIGVILIGAVGLLILKPSLLAATIYGGKTSAPSDKPISFAARSLLWLLSAKESNGRRFLSHAEEEKLGRIVVSRIRSITAAVPLFPKFAADAPLFLMLWARYGSREETNHYLTGLFHSDPSCAVASLQSYARAAPGGKFSPEQYAEVSRVVDPGEVANALFRRYGHSLENLPETAPERQVIVDFLSHHSGEQAASSASE
ncbi:MAG: hypothetical protein ABID87_07600 [Chloroflexota bacterium]